MEVRPEGLEQLPFEQFFLQPLDGPHLERNTRLVEAYCRAHPHWKVSLQTHKLLGIP
jgi:organic radical activating enzyme